MARYVTTMRTAKTPKDGFAYRRVLDAEAV
jgi:hypothetical protein